MFKMQVEFLLGLYFIQNSQFYILKEGISCYLISFFFSFFLRFSSFQYLRFSNNFQYNNTKQYKFYNKLILINF